jgi:16S rRNA C967 or C1407 C5-methylase (RsmB/RsmF family)
LDLLRPELWRARITTHRLSQFRFTAKAYSQNHPENLLERVTISGRGNPALVNRAEFLEDLSAQKALKTVKTPPNRTEGCLPSSEVCLKMGLIYFQDEGSQLVAQLVGAQTRRASA